jgi:DNA repair protein RadD
MTALFPLRDHQQRAIDGLRASLATGHRRPLLQAPTGAGKTVIAAHLLAMMHERGKRLCFVVPSLSLVDQTFDRFVANGIPAGDMGVMQGNHPWRRPGAPIQIATAQTLARRDLPDSDVVIVDEAHVRHKIIPEWMALDPQRIFIGLSATPWAVGMGKLYDDLVKPTSTAELIENGFLSRFKVFAPSHPDLTGIKTVAGDYHEGELGERMSDAKLIGDIVETWLLKGRGRPTLAFCVTRAHAATLQQRFEAVGVACGYCDANTEREARDQLGRDLAAGKLEVIVNVGTLTTGVDWDVRCIILARPTKSEMLFVQIIGRGLRTAEGKDHCVILDHSDTHLRLGMVTDIDADVLDDGTQTAKEARKRKPKLALPKECPSCAGLIPALVTECPCCGAAAPRPMGPREGEGDLVEIGGRKVPTGSVIDVLRTLPKAELHGMLVHVAEARGKKLGWAAYAYKDVHGVWPRAKWAHPVPPDPLVLSWLKHRAIRWAKAQEAKRAVEVHHGL